MSTLKEFADDSATLRSPENLRDDCQELDAESAAPGEMGRNPATVTPFLSRTWTFVLVSLWGLAIAAGFGAGILYENTPTRSNVADSLWPTGSSCTLSPDRPTLMMFVHPRCPCSRASVNELAVLMTRCQDRVNAQVLFFEPPSTSTDWAQTDLWETAATIPGVTVKADRGGVEQRRFGSRVSGEVFLYLPSGELAFHGGITAGRGHAGDNAGRAALESILLAGQAASATTSVFGCELESPNSQSPQRPAAAKSSANP